MSRALGPALLLLALLGGCSVYPTAEQTPRSGTTLKVVETCSLQRWLAMQEEVAAMTSEQASAALAGVDPLAGSADLFYYGLLKQQLQFYEAWAEARDTFRALQEEAGLTLEQRQMAALLEAYNQRRINWYQRYSELQQQYDSMEQALADAEQEKALLQQKIQALTDLEAVISDRKEQ
ncbi:MAG: hypothetical protein P8Y92_18835 [Halioglobus sp.]